MPTDIKHNFIKKIKTKGMIKLEGFGKHDNVLIAQFGGGDIMITKGAVNGEKYQSLLIFHNQEPRKVGATTDEFKGLTSDDLPTPGFVMAFKNAKSITAVMHMLIELQSEVLAKEELRSEGERVLPVQIFEGETTEELYEQAVRILTTIRPPEKFGEDTECANLYDLIGELKSRALEINLKNKNR